ncbi:MAG: Asp23/Gls24 family envelope stress response protein [Syntrophomonas sp.]|nr:Asp23/Gls24 family envelope stress response protein [Syntrophomonas sp.]
MYKIRSNEMGDITVTRELVETLAGLATLDCYGLVGMVPQNIQSGISNILRIDSIRKGVQVSSSDKGLIIDVYVIVGYGIRITEVASNVMQKVTYVLENNAELPVASVNVNVRGVKVLRDI